MAPALLRVAPRLFRFGGGGGGGGGGSNIDFMGTASSCFICILVILCIMFVYKKWNRDRI